MMIKTFKEHLILTESPISNDDALTMLMSNRSFVIPLSSKTMQRIFKNLPRVIVYHRTSIDGLKTLKKIQGSKKSISTSNELSERQLFRGVETLGGTVVQLEGTLLLNSDIDAYTSVDSQGRRWFEINRFLTNEQIERRYNVLFKALKNMFNTDPNVNSLPSKISDTIKNDLKSLLDINAFFGNFSGRGTRFHLITPEERKEHKETIGKIKARIITMSMGIIEKLLKENIDHILKSMPNMVKAPKTHDNLFLLRPTFNELVVNEIKILKVAVAARYDSSDLIGLNSDEREDPQTVSTLKSLNYKYFKVNDPKLIPEIKAFFKTQ